MATGNFDRGGMIPRAAYMGAPAVSGGVYRPPGPPHPPPPPLHHHHISPPPPSSVHPPLPPVNAGTTSIQPSNPAPTPAANVSARGCIATLDAYHNLSKIGEGTYGFVYQATDRRSGEKVALKKLLIHKESYGFPLIAIREIKFLKSLSHRGIVHLKEVVSSKGCEDMEAAQAGDVVGSRFHQQQQQEQRSSQGGSSSQGANSSSSGAVGGDASVTSSSSSSAASAVNVNLASCGHLYLVFEYVEHDLAGLIASRYKFNLKEIQCLMQQLFDALGYLHDQKIMHRDIKSSNILISNRMYLKLADFGLARSVDNIYNHPAILGGEGVDPFDYDYHEPSRASGGSALGGSGGGSSGSNRSALSSSRRGGVLGGDGSIQSNRLEPQYTNNVITMWYRPPELLLGAVSYGCGVDVWSAGCVLAEMAILRPLMPGKTELEQFDLICRLIGTPSEATWPDISQLPYAESMLGEVAKYTADIRSTLTNVVPSAVVDILERLLVHDPARRSSARAALGMRFFHGCPKAHEMPPLNVPGGSSFHEFETLHKKKGPADATSGVVADAHARSSSQSAHGSSAKAPTTSGNNSNTSAGSSSSSSSGGGSRPPVFVSANSTMIQSSSSSSSSSSSTGRPGGASYAAALMRPAGDRDTSKYSSSSSSSGSSSYNNSSSSGSYAPAQKKPRFDSWSSSQPRR